MIRARLRVASLSLLAGMLLCSCGDSESVAWQQALHEDSSAGYATYLQHFPNGMQAGRAASRAKALADQQDWQIAVQRDSSAAYQTYLDLHRDGVWRELAQARIEPAPVPAPVEAVAPVVTEPASEPPEATAPAAPKRASPASREQSRPRRPDNKIGVPAMVQIGVFSSEARARAAWAAAQAASPALREKFMQIDRVQGASQPLYRLRAAVGRPAAATAVCAELARATLQCVVVGKQ